MQCNCIHLYMLCKLVRKSWRCCEKQICTDGFGPKNCGEIAEGILRKAANKATLQRSWSKEDDPNKLAKTERCDIRVSFRSKKFGPKNLLWTFLMKSNRLKIGNNQSMSEWWNRVGARDPIAKRKFKRIFYRLKYVQIYPMWARSSYQSTQSTHSGWKSGKFSTCFKDCVPYFLNVPIVLRPLQLAPLWLIFVILQTIFWWIIVLYYCHTKFIGEAVQCNLSWQVWLNYTNMMQLQTVLWWKCVLFNSAFLPHKKLKLTHSTTRQSAERLMIPRPLI